MVDTNSTQLTAIALNFEGSEAPAWIQLIPAGHEIRGRDGRRWILPNPETVIAAFASHGADLPIDIEHATQLRGPKGMSAPAVGWIKEMEVREGSLWARVEWTHDGQSAVGSKGYRYVSPAFTFHKASGEILKMVSAGLTNNPNLHLAALNSGQASEETDDMDKAILEALGLNASASAADAVVAINKLKEAKITALNSAQNPDPGKFVPKADHDLALNRITTFEAADKTREGEAINAAVDAAVTAGKVAPASRDYHIASCKADGGLERFNTMIKAAPVIAAGSGLDKKDPALNAAQLTDEELAVCRQMDMDPKDFALAKAEKE